MLTLLIILLFSSVCRCQITLFNNETNRLIIENLKEKKLENVFETDPLYLIDGKPIIFENFNDLKYLNSNEIEGVYPISKISGVGKAVWGVIANEGVLVINTNRTTHPEAPSAENSDILFLLDNKIVSKERISELDEKKDIESVTIYKNPFKYQTLSGESYHGIISITSKKL